MTMGEEGVGNLSYGYSSMQVRGVPETSSIRTAITD